MKTVSKQSLYSTCIFFSGRKTPSVPGPPLYRGLTITLIDTTHSTGLLWTSKLPTQTSTWQKKITTDRHRFPQPDSNTQLQRASERLQTHALGSAATVIGFQRVLGLFIYLNIFVRLILRCCDVDAKMTVEWRTTEYLEKSVVTQSRFKANAFCQLQREPIVRWSLKRVYFGFCV